MTRLEKRVGDYIACHGLAPAQGCRAYVALSGGADSVALLAVMTALGYSCRALHCNFGLRGDESDRDELHAVATARGLGVETEVTRFDVGDYIANHRGTSVEMACRELRYDWFDTFLAAEPGAVVALGHHREDNVETMLLNALRGTGLRGLTGMPVRRGGYVRPLLGCSRQEILDYLGARGLGYVTDSSNLTSDYRRNALRNEIIPLISRYFPAGTAGLELTIENLSATRELLDAEIARARERYVDPSGNIGLEAMKAAEPCAARLLYELLNDGADRHIDMSVVDDMIACRGNGKEFANSGGNGYLLDRGVLLKLSPADMTGSYTVDLTRDINEPLAISVELLPAGEFAPRRDENVAWFDAAVLDGSPRFEIRHWREGDRLKPFGMKGSRKLSDLFTDARLSRVDKSRRWILTRDGEVMWVPGMRASRLFPVTPASRLVVRLEVKSS